MSIFNFPPSPSDRCDFVRSFFTIAAERLRQFVKHALIERTYELFRQGNAGLFGGAMPITSTSGTARRDRAQSKQQTDGRHMHICARIRMRRHPERPALSSGMT